MTSDPPILERASKAAAVLTVSVIVVLFLYLHPDQTWQLRVAGIAAFAAGWFASRTGGLTIQTLCLVLAPLAPATLRALTGLEGPVLDLSWMAAFTASVVRSTTWTTWALPPSWRATAGTWVFALALALPVVVLREVQFEPTGFWELGRINGEAGLSAAHAVMWTLFVVWTSLIGLLWIDRTSAQLQETPGTIPVPAHGLWIGGTLASMVALYQGLVDMRFANTVFWADQGRATGTLLDANAYGVVAALAGPLAFRAIASGGGHGSLVLAVGALLLNVGGVWLSGSRTAALCLAVGIVALLGSVAKGSTAMRRRLVPITALGVALTVLLVVVGGNATGPVRRLLELPDSPRAAASAVLNRGPYGTIAALMIVEHPLAGVGPGGYNIIAPDYYRRLWGSGLPFDNAQNWWRQIVAEGGLLGGLAPLILSALLAWCVLRVPSAPGQRRQATLVRGLLLALGLASGIQAPTQAPVVMLWFATLAGWLPSLLSPAPSRAWSRPWPAGAWVAGLALAAGFVAAQASLAAGDLSPVARARRTGRPYVAGAYQEELIPDSDTGRFNWTSGHARYDWPAATPWLVLRFWVPHPDVDTQPVRVTITSSCGVLVDELVATHDEYSVGLRLPRDLRWLSADVRVSRTWQPSADRVSADTRRLGVGLVAGFAEREDALTPQRWLDLTSCRSAGAV